jgi:hypothetical protein
MFFRRGWLDIGRVVLIEVLDPKGRGSTITSATNYVDFELRSPISWNKYYEDNTLTLSCPVLPLV